MEESHPAIIDKEMWEAVQLETERRQLFSEKYKIQKVEPGLKNNPMAGKIICGSCSKPFGRRVWSSNDERFKKQVWICTQRNKTKGIVGCNNRHIYDKILKEVFIDTFNTLIENKDFFFDKWNDIIKSGNQLQKYKSKQFIEILNKAKPIKEFDEKLFFIFIEKMTVYEGQKIIVTLLDGIEIEVIVE